MAIPSTIPKFRAVARVPEATPIEDFGTEFIIRELFGAVKMEIPKPTRASRHTAGNDECRGVSKESRNNPILNKLMPTVHSMVEPILSDNAPASGENTDKNTKGVTITKPDSLTENPQGCIRKNGMRNIILNNDMNKSMIEITGNTKSLIFHSDSGIRG